MNFTFFIAKRYLISKKSHNAINIISIIAVTGVCIATMSMIVVLSAFNGLSDLVKSLYNSFSAEIQLSPTSGKTFYSNDPLIEKVKQLENVAFYADVVEAKALVKYKEKQAIATIKGVSTDFVKMNHFDTLIYDGEFSIARNNIVMGKGIYYLLQASVNDFTSPINLFAPKRGNTNSIDPQDGLNELKVYPAGTFSINDEFDDNYILTSIENARTLFDYSNEITTLELALKDRSKLEETQQEIEKIVGKTFIVKNKEQQNSMIFKTMRSEKLWTFIILVFILIIATFNVIGSISMLIIEKKKDIEILNSLGADRSTIKKIFLTEGMIISFTGAIIGLMVGITLCWIQIRYSLITFSEGFVVDAYPVKISISDIFLILLAVLLIGFIAAWYPVKNITEKRNQKFQLT